jgi:hypothetical protein
MRAARMGSADLDDNRSTAAAQLGHSPDGRSASVIDEPKNRPEVARAANSIVIVSQGIGQSLEKAVRRTAPPAAGQIVVVITRCPLLSYPGTSANGHGGQHDHQN